MGDRGESISKKNKKQPRRKILLMGSEKSGKTSMFSLIFTYVYPIETTLFESTQSISLNKIIFSGGEFIELNDCGGKEKYIKEYLTIKKDIFENVFSFIFVINAESHQIKSSPNNNNINVSNSNKDLDYLQQCINLLNKSSPYANIFIIVNKMDKAPVKYRKLMFEKNKQEVMQILQNLEHFNSKNKIKFYETSIWDESIYIPWREIMCDKVLKNTKIQKGLQFLLEACDADEIFLIEKNTFLCIDSVDNGQIEKKENRIKKISFLIKKLKLAIRKFKADFSCIKMKMNNIMVYFEEFNNYSYIMILSQRPKINCAVLEINISILKKKLQKGEQNTTQD
jgi:GTPase SAR1 family protein